MRERVMEIHARGGREIDDDDDDDDDMPRVSVTFISTSGGVMVSNLD